MVSEQRYYVSYRIKDREGLHVKVREHVPESDLLNEIKLAFGNNQNELSNIFVSIMQENKTKVLER